MLLLFVSSLSGSCTSFMTPFRSDLLILFGDCILWSVAAVSFRCAWRTLILQMVDIATKMHIRHRIILVKEEERSCRLLVPFI